MDITNAKQAHEWLREWGKKLRWGIAAEAVRGLRMCEGISRTRGSYEMAADYSDAADVIEQAMRARAGEWGRS